MRPPTPRGALGATPGPRDSLHVVSPLREVSMSSPKRGLSASRGPSMPHQGRATTSPAPLVESSRRSSSLDRSAFLIESPDKQRCSLEKESRLLDTSNSSAVNQSRTYHLEESLVMAKSRSDRYEQELIAEMDRNTALARQSARLREENTALKEELRTANAKATGIPCKPKRHRVL